MTPGNNSAVADDDDDDDDDVMVVVGVVVGGSAVVVSVALTRREIGGLSSPDGTVVIGKGREKATSQSNWLVDAPVLVADTISGKTAADDDGGGDGDDGVKSTMGENELVLACSIEDGFATAVNARPLRCCSGSNIVATVAVAIAVAKDFPDAGSVNTSSWVIAAVGDIENEAHLETCSQLVAFTNPPCP